MPVDGLGPLPPLPRLQPLTAPTPAGGPDGTEASGPTGGFAAVLNKVLTEHQQANAAADTAIQNLATGQAQDLHEVSMAIAQADISFRMMLELRNRLSDAFQEISRMQL